MTLLRTTNCVFFSNTNLMARHIFTQRRGFYAETTASLMSVWTLEQAATVDRLVLISAIYLRAIISKFSNPKEDEGWTGDQIPRTSNSLSSTRLSRKKRERGTGERAWESGGERERKKNCGRGRGRKSRRRERWADDKKAAPADVVTTVGVRGESCVPDAWGRDGGEVSWSVRCHVWPLGCGLASGHRHRSSPRADGVIWRSKRVWPFSQQTKRDFFCETYLCNSAQGTDLCL